MMNCSSCGTQIPPGTLYCPTCGVPTPYALPGSESWQYDPTATSSSSSEEAALNKPTVALSPYDSSPQTPPPPPPPPSTMYGSEYYEASQQNPYGPFDPYAVPKPAPPAPRRRVKTGVVIATIVLVLAMLSAGIFELAKNTSLGKNLAPAVNSTQTAQAQATTTAQTNATLTPQTPYPPSNAKPVLNDPLSNNTEGYQWDITSDAYGGCAFTRSAYQASTVAGYFRICTAENTAFANFAYEVQMTIIKGDCGGIFFRAESALTHYYFFRVCQDGSYALFIYLGPAGSAAASQNRSLVSGQTSSEINTGLNQVNLVAIVAQGNTLELYVNHQQIDNTIDNTYNEGQIAVGADGFPEKHATEVIYSNAKVWQL